MTSKQYKGCRKRLGLTQVELACILQVSPMTIKRRERGETITEEAALALLAIAREMHKKPNT